MRSILYNHVPRRLLNKNNCLRYRCRQIFENSRSLKVHFPLSALAVLANQFYKLPKKMDMSSSSPKNLNFIQRINKDGTSEWVIEPQDYDYNQEIARAAYADMLHDHDRNVKYYNAIKLAVNSRHSANEPAIVLDIGTGTGLLSMMSLAAGADIVYACEAFNPMAMCADKILERNKFRDRVHLIPNRSTELQIGKHMSCRANILVTEVFDTELIGEGAIEIFNHAKRELLTPDCIVIPSAARMMAQVVDCPLITSWNKLDDFDVTSTARICFPPEVSKCSGVPCVQDLQLSEIKTGEFTKIGEEITIFNFNWNQIQPLERISEHKLEGPATPVTASAVFMWWDLQMDPLGENVISCRPSWAGPSAWRDHWMQAVYHLPSPLQMTPGSDYKLKCAHDEFSFWFKVTESESPNDIEPKHPICTCGVHISLSRNRIGMLNDPERREKFIKKLETVIVRGESVVLVISEGSLLGLIAARLGAKKVFALDFATSKITRSLAEYNGLDVVKVIEKSPSDLQSDDFDGLKIDVVLGDPYFQTPVQPWNHITQWQDALQALSWSFSAQPIILPSSAEIKCVAVDFEHLWKIRAPVGTVCGFDLSDFDKLIEKSSDLADSVIDSQPLWEYPGIACSREITLESLDFKLVGSSNEPSEQIEQLNSEGNPNGLALWVDWKWDSDVLTTGPIENIQPGHLIKWDRNWKQGVHLLKETKYLDLAKWWRTSRQ